ncbi:MAG: AI-2E family transporter [Patescibacteria group bacterium]
MNPNGLNITWASLWRVFFMIILATVLFFAVDVLVALFLAVVVSSALDPIVTWLEKKKIPRILGTLAIYIVAVFILAFIIYAIVPIALSEFSSLLNSLNEKISRPDLAFINISQLVDAINEGLGRVTNVLISGSQSFLDITSKFFGGIALTASVFVLSFYLTVGKDGVERFLLTILPPTYEARAIELYTKVRRKIGRWLRGQMLLSLVIGVTVFLGLWLLGVKYSLILGILAGIFELVPYVGPIFSGSVAVLVAATDSLTLGVYALLLFILIQQIENNVLVPAVMSLTTSLNPVVILISLLVGAKLFGFIGLILAVPAAVLLQEIIEDWSESRKRNRGAA